MSKSKRPTFNPKTAHYHVALHQQRTPALLFRDDAQKMALALAKRYCTPPGNQPRVESCGSLACMADL